MKDDPLQLMLDRLNAIAESNAETRKAVADIPRAVSAAAAEANEPVTKKLEAQSQAFGEMRAHHAETLKAAKAAPAWAVIRGTGYVLGGFMILVLAAILVLRASGQVHIAAGTPAGFCATRPVEQPNGARACWETPPADEEAAGRLQVCLEPSFMSNRGRRACWLDPPPPKPVPGTDG